MRSPSIAIASVILMSAFPALGADWMEHLQSDLVRVENATFIQEVLSVCEFRPPQGSSARSSRKFQVRSHAEAPAKGVISRDRFVSLVSEIETPIALAMAEADPDITPSQALDAFECDEIEEPIGTVDVTIRTSMTHEGLQVEIVTPEGAVSRSTRTWEDVYGE